ncbi:NAD-dependent protein deacylase [Penicillium macrosclerotiorum]|uniref:NAD-dependent protein deacylase n=1 Tax=Penicillium macrosclerotiorum TaxID=303699 RepID=UPI0025483C96|nr:NAD-dependent protein deacylase [Penicillium macrosclerotiorum]KAJ5688786.1 NAD-dependent protein deacylase [Penicillium macrosclerotiorum]
MAAAAKHALASPGDVQSFTECLKNSRRILALLGAGISAASGLPTFRGAGGLWRQYDATSLATPEAFDTNPGLVWQFYSYRRHMALQAQPNRAHHALVELARQNKDFITLSQNVDGLSQRAGHPAGQLHLLHGSLFDLKCTSFYCNYTLANDFTDPIVPALDIPKLKPNLTASPTDQINGESTQSQQHILAARAGTGEVDISDATVPISQLTPEDLPQCPKCNGLLRPGVVWFGEPLPGDTLSAVDNWIESAPVDLILVIGTSSSVYPAAGYVQVAQDHGARVAVINMDRNDMPSRGQGTCDWFFQGDAAVIVPEILRSVIGDIGIKPVFK